MAKHIIYKKTDGSVAIAVVLQDVDIEEIVRKYMDIHTDVASYSILNQAPVLPENRLFRNAWGVDNKNKVTIDSDKAKEMHMRRLREVRNKKLQEMDAETMKALPDSDKLAEIEQKKQKLRDVPQNIDLSKLDLVNPKKLWPVDLEMHLDYK